MDPVRVKARQPAFWSSSAGFRLIGVDPGLIRTGYAIVRTDARLSFFEIVDAGVIRLDQKAVIHERLVELQHNLAELLERHRPRALVCEQLYAHYKHPRTAILMGHARGVILALGAGYGLAVRDIAATQAKKYLTGSGRATKVQVQRAVAATLNLPRLPEPNDVADALSIALAGAAMLQGDGYLATEVSG